MRNELLYRDNHLAIEYNSSGDWLYVNWKGYHDYNSIVAGCEKLLALMKEHACYKILNDNTHVEGKWSSASKWVVEIWLPAMQEAGLKWFAWVYSPSILSRLSTDKTLKLADYPDFIKVYDELDLACDWLRTKV